MEPLNILAKFEIRRFSRSAGCPKDWRRRPGRARHTWLRTLDADLHPLNHRLNSAWRLAQDRERWRHQRHRRTTCDGKTALCTIVHRAVKKLLWRAYRNPTSYNCHLTRPPRGTPANIRIRLIFPETIESLGYIVAADIMGLSSFV